MTIERLIDSPEVPMNRSVVFEEGAIGRLFADLALDLSRVKLRDIHQRINLILDTQDDNIAYFGLKDLAGKYPDNSYRINGSGTNLTIQIYDYSADTWTTILTLGDDGTFTTIGGRILNTTRIDHTDSPYTVLPTDHKLVCDTDGGTITVNLPAGVDGTEYIISNTGTSGNDVTVDPDGTEQLFRGGAGVAETLMDLETFDLVYEAAEGWV